MGGLERPLCSHCGNRFSGHPIMVGKKDFCSEACHKTHNAEKKAFSKKQKEPPKPQVIPEGGIHWPCKTKKRFCGICREWFCPICDSEHRVECARQERENFMDVSGR